VATRKTQPGSAGSSSAKGASSAADGSSTGSSSRRSAKRSTAASTAAGAGSSRRTSRSRTSEANAAGATARARIASARARSKAGSRPKEGRPDLSIAEPTVTATDDALAATNAGRALNPDMSRVAWLRTQLQNLEAQRAERLVKVGQLTLIAIVFITFVLQNAQGVNVHFLLFAINIRLIWVIFGCGLLGGVAGYLIGRPEKSLRALFPDKAKKPSGNGSSRHSAKI
jgi:uncharacterized integral membrane protein